MVFQKIEEIYIPFNRALTQIEGVAGLWMGDDMGFRSETMVHPDHLRKYVFPLQKKVADLCHEQGILFLLHSCGNLATIMDELIDNVGIDGKHSFEDVIMPVESFVAKFGERISTIGGVDVNLLSRCTKTEIRSRVRAILEACTGSGAYVLGSGNSITNYVPFENFLTMIDECQRFNAEGWGLGFPLSAPQSNLERKTAGRRGNISFVKGSYHFSHILEMNDGHVLELGIAQGLLNLGPSFESV